MTYANASTNLRDIDFQTRCALAIASLAAVKIVNQVVMTPFEANMAKLAVKDPMSYSSMITSVMLQVPSMHATAAPAMPTDADFDAAAAIVWPYLVVITS